MASVKATWNTAYRERWLALAFLLSIFAMGFAVPRSATWILWSLYAVSWSMYGLIWHRQKKQNGGFATLFWVLVGMLARLVLVFAPVLWSDDIYRFIWDGRLVAEGIHPFLHTPQWYADRGFPVEGLDSGLFGRLNSPEYHTVYPPLAQAVFALSGLIFPKSVVGGIVVIKLLLLMAECLTVWVLNRLQTERHTFSLSVTYALNPLAIMEGCGNGHFEVAALAFVLIGVYMLRDQRLWSGSAPFAAAVALKLTPLIFMPLLWRYLGFRRGLYFQIGFAVIVVLLFLPLLHPDVLYNMSESLDLYFRQFQFNASVYYFIRWLGYAHVGYDIGEASGPMLGIASAVSILIAALLYKPVRERDGIVGLARMMTWTGLVHLSLSAVVHPWYVLLIFGVGLVGNLRFPIWWTGLVILSYSHYAQGQYEERFGWITLEYVLLWITILWEACMTKVAPGPPE